MSAARIFGVAISLLTLVLIVAIAGCAPDRTGTASPNLPPQVFITNTPPDSAQFSRNPDLNWYATDKDGYIVYFRYAVVVDSMLLIDGNHVTPDAFIQSATDRQFGWDTLRVDLDHPQSTARIRLYANVDFPVDSFVTQYFFIQAEDDRGAKSDIKYRMYSRNNHYPNTHFRANATFINAKDIESPAPGITLDWDGADSTDWGRALPPLEFEWRLYGPFEEDAPIYVKQVKEDCVYDPTVDSFVNCILVPVLDIPNLPPVVGNKPQPLIHSQGPNFDEDSNDVWVTYNEIAIYNVFAGMDLQKTSRYKFVFWVRARDDGFVPDPTPSFAQFRVYEALFEKPVMVIDETGYDSRNGRWAPRDIDTAKAYFQNTLHEMGYTEFDSTYYELENDTGPVDYFYAATRGNTAGRSIPTVNAKPDLLDILSHRVMIFYNDDSQGGPQEGTFGLLSDVFFGLDMGSTALMLARNLGDATQNDTRGRVKPKSAAFQARFGISQVIVEGWLADVIFNNFYFNEEFIGGYANLSGYPHLMLKYGPDSLLDTRYPNEFLRIPHTFNGLPEIGVGTRTQFAAPLYLYLSKDGDKSIFHGKVNAVLQQIGEMRTACFMFTPLAIDPEPMNEVLGSIIPWLEAKFDVAPKVSLKGVTSYSTPFSSIEARRERVQQFLDYLEESAEPEEVLRYVGPPLKPFVLSPGDAE